jgi:four helix bundle protein
VTIAYNYKKLKIGEMRIQRTSDVFDLIKPFPVEERYGLISQLNRWFISISNNIEKGSSLKNKSLSHFIDIPLGSSFELDTQMFIAKIENILQTINTIPLKIKFLNIKKWQQVLKKH